MLHSPAHPFTPPRFFMKTMLSPSDLHARWPSARYTEMGGLLMVSCSRQRGHNLTLRSLPYAKVRKGKKPMLVQAFQMYSYAQHTFVVDVSTLVVVICPTVLINDYVPDWVLGLRFHYSSLTLASTWKCAQVSYLPCPRTTRCCTGSLAPETSPKPRQKGPALR